MEFNPVLIMSLVGSILLLSFTVGFLYHIYTRDKRFAGQRDEAYTQSTQMIDEAHHKAVRIIERAVEHASETLDQTTLVKRDILVKMETDMKDVSDATVKLLREQSLEFSKDYKEVLDMLQDEHGKILGEAKLALDEVESLKGQLIEDLRTKTAGLADATAERLNEEAQEINKEYRNVLSQTIDEYKAKALETVKTIESIPEQELKDFREILKKETIESQQLIAKRINEAFDAAQKEIDEYKQAQIAKINASVEGTVKRVLEQVLPNSLSDEDHLKLIQSALEQAKKDKVFDTLGNAPN